jgi:hypothetical protein
VPAATTSATSPASVAADAATTGSRLITFSSRADVTAANPLAAGFTLTGSNAKNVLLRAVGPGLGAFGVTGTLANPELQLYDSAGHLIIATTAWSGDSSLISVFNQVGAFPLLAGSADAATVVSLLPGTYTLQVAGAIGQSGAALAEVYDADSNPLTAAGQISAVSTHAALEAGGSLVGGFAVTGGSTQTVLVRAIGPALGAAGIGAPVLGIYDSQGNLLARNAGWGNATTVNGSYPAATAAAIIAATTTAGATALPVGGTDSAAVLTLPAGAYTAQVIDANGQAGTAAVEVYKLSP